MDWSLAEDGQLDKEMEEQLVDKSRLHDSGRNNVPKQSVTTTTSTVESLQQLSVEARRRGRTKV